MGFQFSISADTPEELTKRIVGFYTAIRAASDTLFPPQQTGSGQVEGGGPSANPDHPHWSKDPGPAEPPKRRGRPAKQQTIDATATEVKSVAQMDLEDAVAEVKAALNEKPVVLEKVVETLAALEPEPKPITKADIDDLLPAWNSEMKMVPAAVVAAKIWLLDNNTGAKRDEIAKLDEGPNAARLLVMQLLQTVGAERISTIPEAKYADVVAFVDAQRAKFGG
jgi:hypothetical protein